MASKMCGPTVAPRMGLPCSILNPAREMEMVGICRQDWGHTGEGQLNKMSQAAVANGTEWQIQ